MMRLLRILKQRIVQKDSLKISDEDRKRAVRSVVIEVLPSLDNNHEISFFDLSTIIITQSEEALIEVIEPLILAKSWESIVAMESCDLEKDLLILRVLRLGNDRWMMAYWVSEYDPFICDRVIKVLELSREDVVCMRKFSRDGWHPL